MRFGEFVKLRLNWLRWENAIFLILYYVRL